MKEELRKAFQNPPKGGNEVGVPTAGSMSPLPSQLQTEGGPFACSVPLGGGEGIEKRRRERELLRMTPEERMKAQEEHWMEKSRRAAAPSGPDQQTSLRESFEKGELSARVNAEHSGVVGQQEVRNYGRGYVGARTAAEPGAPPMFYDKEQDDIDPHALATGGKRPDPGVIKRVTPELRPTLPNPERRSDGKINYKQGAVANGNVGPQKPGMDRNGGI